MVEKTFTEPSRAELSRAEPVRSDGESYNIPLYVSANAVERLGFCYPASLSLSPAVMKSHLPARLDWTRWCCRGDIFFFFFLKRFVFFIYLFFFLFRSEYFLLVWHLPLLEGGEGRNLRKKNNNNNKKKEHQWVSGTPPAPEDHTLAGRLRFTRSVL